MGALNGGEQSLSPDQIPVNDAQLQRLRDLKRLKDLGPSWRRGPSQTTGGGSLSLCLFVSRLGMLF